MKDRTEYRRAYYQANRERVLAQQKEYAAKNRDQIRARKAKVRGWTAEQVLAAEAAQGGRCAVCDRPPTGARGLHCDHDHETGAPRQLLCHNCNLALGHAEDSPARLLALAAYLQRHGR